MRYGNLYMFRRRSYDNWKVAPKFRTCSPQLAPAFLGRLCGHFPGCQHSSHDRGVQFVLSLTDIPRLVSHTQDEDRQRSFLAEILFRDRDGKNPVETMFAVGGLITMLPRVPGENADWIEVVRQPVVGIGQHAQILRDLFLHPLVAVLYFVQNKESNETLAFGVLRDFERDVHITHPTRLRVSRTSHQSSSTGPAGAFAPGFVASLGGGAAPGCFSAVARSRIATFAPDASC